MTTPANESVDVFRDTPVRYFGYSNELGESFKAFISKGLYRSTYAVAIAYGLSDALDKGYKAKLACEESDARVRVGLKSESAASSTISVMPCSSTSEKLSTKSDHSTQVALAVADTFVWQLFASVALPGIFINRAVAATQQALKSQEAELSKATPERAVHGRFFSRISRHPSLLRWAPTAVGLGLIPLIIHPIDYSVTW
eukprot:CAMPEP_0198211060 /NCGR_PEP_ID=MMETSP1445-20131203/22602_1 /TAXON_ID=36898 /ORGANISM="Pyramimonas sp., Strain CCMP2087" /LENGTH=198 /DNA_ID=CAMNT_0043885253 /DNA_START=241 /DNA_END=834 /DNA_ORIENTATION=-